MKTILSLIICILFFINSFAYAIDLKAIPHQRGTSYMIAITNPYASESAHRILKQGGNAMDAMVAALATVTAVEPEMAGFGGGAFLTYYNAKTGKVTGYDGRETAPLSLDIENFRNDKGRPLPREKVFGALAVAVPGAVKMLEMAHKEQGQLPWKPLFTHAIEVSTIGYPINTTLHGILKREKYRLVVDPGVSKLFYAGSETPKPAGSWIKNPELASTLELISEKGSAPFYQGEIADKIIEVLKQSKVKGIMQKSDLARYKAVKRPIRDISYRNYRIMGIGAPASGTIMVEETLGILNHFDLKSLGPSSPKSWFLLVEAMRLSLADRLQYIGDPDFKKVPTTSLLNTSYLKKRATLISDIPMKEPVLPGDPSGVSVQQSSSEGTSDVESHDTTHMTIIDEYGNVASMTATIGTGMGSGVLAAGMVMNAQMTNFIVPHKGDDITDGPGHMMPGKRPRSATAPLLIFDRNGKFKMAIGSPGGGQIPGYVAKTIIGVIDWGLSLQDAIDLPNIQYGSKIDRTERTVFRGVLIEGKTPLEPLYQFFKEVGYERIHLLSMMSGLNGILIHPDGTIEGAVDRRRGGFAIGK